MAIDINFYGGPEGSTAREFQLNRQCAELRQLLKAAEDELQERRARDVRVRLLASDMRDWCSPHGVAIEYANRLQAAIDGPGVIATHTANHPAAVHAPDEARP